MRQMSRVFAVLVGMTCLYIVVPGARAAAQEKKQQPLLSPRRSAEFVLTGQKISVDYGSPSMRGRKIMGGLVPWNEVWRTGANEATGFKTDVDLVMGAVTIPKGSYTLYTLPSEAQWKLIINKQTGQWGTEYHGDRDLARIDLTRKTLDTPVEQFTISFDKDGDGGVMKLTWETTELSITFTAKK